MQNYNVLVFIVLKYCIILLITLTFGHSWLSNTSSVKTYVYNILNDNGNTA